jgi:DNA-binding response OmpR family regulator
MTRLNGCRVLVVEDDDVTSQALCLALNDLGATVIGPAADVASALDLVERHGEIDAALLDINLGRELVYPVAEALVARDVPFIFATACPVYDMPTMFWHMLRQEKPYDMRVLADRMSALCEMRSKAVLPSVDVATDIAARQPAIDAPWRGSHTQSARPAPRPALQALA